MHSAMSLMSHTREQNVRSDKSPATQAARVVGELEVLNRWLAQSGSAPMLLLAPFGSGKSVIAETFALALAEQLLDETLYPEDGAVPWVPVPIRLRAWNWHAGELLDEYLVRSQLVFDGINEAGILGGEQVALLRHAGRLVPLFDGFDELPGQFDSEDGSDPRRSMLAFLKALAKPRTGLPCRFVVTARPGTGIERDALFRERQHLVCEYDTATISEYVSRQIAPADANEDSSADKAIRAALDSNHHLLRRPLFLAVWCEELTHDRQTLLEGGVGRFMEHLVVKALDVRRIRQWLNQSTIQSKRFADIAFDRADILRMLSALGALLFIFAERGFPARLSLSQLDARVRELLPVADERHLAWLTFLAERAGLIIRINDTEVYSPKIPIVEFLVGRFFAGLVAESDSSAALFVNVFRRWVWLPDLHDLLGFTFDSLRRGRREQQEMAAECSGWLLAVSEACPLHGKSKSATVAVAAQDDLLRPLALLAIRLGADENRSLRAIVAAEVRAGRHHYECTIPIVDLLPAEYLGRTIPFLADAHRVEADEHCKRRLIYSMHDVVGRVHPPEAPEAVEHLISGLSVTGDAQEEIGVWSFFVDAVERLAARIAVEDRKRHIFRWLRIIAEATGKDAQWLYTIAILSVTERLPEADAPDVAHELENAVKDAHFAHVAQLLDDAVAKSRRSPAPPYVPIASAPDVPATLETVDAAKLAVKLQALLAEYRTAATKETLEECRMWFEGAAKWIIAGDVRVLVDLMLRAVKDASLGDARYLARGALARALAFSSADQASVVVSDLLDSMNTLDPDDEREFVLLNAIQATGACLEPAAVVPVALAVYARMLRVKGTCPAERKRQFHDVLGALSRSFNPEQLVELCRAMGHAGDALGIVRVACGRPDFTVVVDGYDEARGDWRCDFRRRDDPGLLLGGPTILLAPPGILRVVAGGRVEPESKRLEAASSAAATAADAMISDGVVRKPKLSEDFAKLRVAIRELLESYPDGLSASEIIRNRKIISIREYSDYSALNKLRKRAKWTEFEVVGFGRNARWRLAGKLHK